MLYKMQKSRKKFGDLEPLTFLDLSKLKKMEKDLENLLAEHLLEVLFEDAPLMPMFQERPMRAEADLYALNKEGDLVIFELKRGIASEDAMHQILRYTQTAGQWTFGKLQEKYRSYISSQGEKLDSLSEEELESLREAHRVAFDLERQLLPSEFNRRQQLIVIGNAANDDLINAVDYWKRQGLSVEFIPYRVYKIGKEHYFEFFALPYDRHKNPSDIKGVIFDTNKNYGEDCIWWMMDKSRIAAYGSQKYVVNYLNPKDIVFYAHAGFGVVAAGEVISKPKHIVKENEIYCDVKFLTPIPRREEGVKQYMRPSQVSEVTGRNFFWARTIKVPYLNRMEARKLVKELNKVL